MIHFNRNLLFLGIKAINKNIKIKIFIRIFGLKYSEIFNDKGILIFLFKFLENIKILNNNEFLI